MNNEKAKAKVSTVTATERGIDKAVASHYLHPREGVIVMIAELDEQRSGDQKLGLFEEKESNRDYIHPLRSRGLLFCIPVSLG